MPIFIDNSLIPKKKFPAGELHVRLTEDEINCKEIYADLRDSEDIWQLILIIDAIKHNCMIINHVTIMIPYLPYARQDRVCHRGEASSCKVLENVLLSSVYTNIPSNLSFSFRLVDLHSNKNYFKNLYEITKDRILFTYPQIIADIDVFLFPDKGAEKQVRYLARRFGKLCSGFKKTRLDSGVITISPEEDIAVIEGKNILVIDDICDGGGTFISLFNTIKHIDFNKLNLYVTHGIFSKGLNVLNMYNHIFTTDTICDKTSTSNLTVFSIREFK